MLAPATSRWSRRRHRAAVVAVVAAVVAAVGVSWALLVPGRPADPLDTARSSVAAYTAALTRDPTAAPPPGVAAYYPGLAAGDVDLRGWVYRQVPGVGCVAAPITVSGAWVRTGAGMAVTAGPVGLYRPCPSDATPQPVLSRQL